MKFKLNKTLVVLGYIALSLAVGCKDAKIDAPVDEEYEASKEESAFTTNFDEVSIIQNGKVYWAFNEESEQIISNSNRDSYMIANIDFSRYHQFGITGEYKEGETVTVKIDGEGNNVLSDGEYQMRVSKLSESGSKVWLWNNEANLGLIIEFPEINQ